MQPGGLHSCYTRHYCPQHSRRNAAPSLECHPTQVFRPTSGHRVWALPHDNWATNARWFCRRCSGKTLRSQVKHRILPSRMKSVRVCTGSMIRGTVYHSHAKVQKGENSQRKKGFYSQSHPGEGGVAESRRAAWSVSILPLSSSN